MLLALLLFAQTSIAVASPAACTGADPAIVSVVVKGVTSDGGMNVFHLSGRVVNVGREKQAANVLQFVNVYQHDIKKDSRGIPPLKPGGSYTFAYDFARALTAGKGTTDLTFRLEMRQPQTNGRQDCNLANDRFDLKF